MVFTVKFTRIIGNWNLGSTSFPYRLSTRLQTADCRAMVPPPGVVVGPAKKRKRAEEVGDYGRKRGHFKDEDSIRQQARRHRILTARMPTKALTSTWSLGKNRRLDVKHVRALCAIFTQGGLNRKAEENHLLVLCSRADVSRMMEHLRRRSQVADSEAPEDVPFFEEWLSVNRGSLVEIMAGQHRVKALEAYVKETGATEGELWWTCEFYDKGKSVLSAGPVH